MAARIKTLDFYADRINSLGEKRLNEKLCEWKNYHNGTEHQGCAKGLATPQRRGSAANRR